MHSLISRTFAFTVLLALPLAADEHRFVLTSVDSNVEVESFQLSDHVSDAIASMWKVQKQTLHGGKQEGVTLVTIDNGELKVTVVPTRGMSILDVRDSKTGKRIFGWDSPVTESVHPSYVDLESRGGLGWLEGFNEWMVRCGLEFAGHPGTDKFINNTGDEAEMTLTLHGKIGNIPASEVELIVEKEAPHRVTLRGVVSERMFYGPQLKLVTEMTMTPGDASILLRDAITNEGADDQEFQVIYHTNFGSPLLEKDARFFAAAKSVTPMNGQAADAIDSYNRYEGPTKGFIEQVYLMEPHADSNNWTTTVLANAAGTAGATVRWDTATLPYLTLWKNTPAKKAGYVTGIEPGTGYPFNRRVERHYDRVPKLSSGETLHFALAFTWLDNAEKVEQAKTEVTKLLAGRSPEIRRDPPENPFED